ncbi:MAG: DUF1269 domain-containing protein [Cellvibrionaceae bacterium]
MQRLCFLSPDIEHTRQLVEDLKRNGISEKHLYTVARPGMDLAGLPDAGSQADDFLPSYGRGFTFGGAAGLGLGLLARFMAPAGLATGGAVLIAGLLGAGLGGLLTGMAGSAFSNSRLNKFQSAIEQGRILVMADVPTEDVGRYESLVSEFEPGIQYAGFEPPPRLIP